MHVTEISTELIHVGKEVAFPKAFVLSFTPGEESTAALTFTLSYSMSRKRFVLIQTLVSSGDYDQEITGQLIRSIPFQEILLKGLSRIKYFDLNTQSLSPSPALEYHPMDRDAMIERGPNSETLDSVALLYRIADVLNANQGKHVQRVLQIPYATAANWISRARQQGAFDRIESMDERYLSLRDVPMAHLQNIASLPILD